MPRKEFESFTRLDASDVNTFLMDQSVQTFAGTAARGSAIATPVEGMVTYLNDIDSLSVYNGTAFTTDRTIQVFAGTAARGSAIGTAVEGMYTHINDTDSLEYYDGSAWVAAGGGGGFSLISTTSFSTASAVSLPDNTFTSTYDNYKILIQLTGNAGVGVVLQYRMRAAGADNTTSNYWNASQGLTTSNGGQNITSATQNTGSLVYSKNNAAVDLTIISPALSLPTTLLGTGWSEDVTGNVFTSWRAGSRHNVSSAFDSITFYLSSGTMSGKIAVYGLGI
jgi:hypothetical protein